MARANGTARFLRALIAMNLRASLALRGAFWLQAAFMVLNNLAFFAVWWLMFDRFPELAGWRLRDMLTVFGVVASGFGISVIFAGGVRELARAIDQGELDTLIVQPKPVLLHAVASRTIASGWGDLATGCAMLVAVGGFHPS